MQPGENIHTTTLIRTKKIRENQYHFFISPQAIKLPSVAYHNPKTIPNLLFPCCFASDGGFEISKYLTL